MMIRFIYLEVDCSITVQSKSMIIIFIIMMMNDDIYHAVTENENN